VPRDGVADGFVDGEVEARRKHERAHHPDGIFLEAFVRIPDAAHDAGAQVVDAAGVVDDRQRADVVEQGVDREITPESVFFGRAKGVVVVDDACGRLEGGWTSDDVSVVSVIPSPRFTDGCPSVASASGASVGVSTTAGSVSVPGTIRRRKVATSTTLVGPNLTCANRKRRPMIQQFRKSFLIW
jgi:hypothetical protein